MKPPPLPKPKPKGFDAGLKCLAAVFAFTIFQRVIIPLVPKEDHERDAALVAVWMIFAAFVVLPTVLWMTKKCSENPPRLWALLACTLWAGAILVIYGVIFGQGFIKRFRERRAADASVEDLKSEGKMDDEEDEARQAKDPMAARRVCIMHLKIIESAKETWALENPPVTVTRTAPAPPANRRRRRNPPPSVREPAPPENPSERDLFGPTAFIRDKPTCPSDGTYIIGLSGEPPRCTHPGHSLDEWLVQVVDESGAALKGAGVSSRTGTERAESKLTNNRGRVTCRYVPATNSTMITAELAGYTKAVVPFSTNSWPLKIVMAKAQP